MASNRSETEMFSVAQNILYGFHTHRAGNTNSLKTLQRGDMLTVIGHEQEGFVIIANDDNVPAVVGYSQMPFTTLPPALEWYLDAADKALKYVTANGLRRTAILPSSEFPSKLDPLVKTHWDQGKPYNNLCPGGNGSSSRLYPTGCVATALSQVMKYYNYPMQGQGEHQYSFQPSSGDGRIIYANFGETHYDWNNMLDDYSSTTYTDEQANAVATLMLHCGVAVDMSYTASGSGAFGQEACLALKTYFRYNKNARLYTRDYYSAESWMKLIYHELNQYGPIYYDGVSDGGGGHAFVLDGYDETGLVHINWGWGGKSDGFFDIALLNPPSYQFSLAQNMILNVSPDANIPYESQIVAKELSFLKSKTSKTSISISGKVYNAGAEGFTGTIACVLQNMETGDITVLRKTDEITIKPIVNGTYWLQPISLLANSVSSVSDGTYRLYVASRTAEDTQWQLVRPLEGQVNNFIVTKSSDGITWEESTDDLWSIDVTTAIQTPIATQSDASSRFFDLQGREVKTPTRGLYIRNGKKVVVK
jgi:hypothetical protein